MARTFPQRFSRKQFQGPRANHFRTGGDAFQQLVGDGMKSRFGVDANVTQTLGRDGGIDIYVDLPDESLPQPLQMAGPVIIECKHHSESATRKYANVLAGWAKVEQKLRAQAQRGWHGPYEPWRRARGYLYCVSAHLANQSVRIALKDRIERFFESLSPEIRPGIEKVRILDWSDLRAWLDELPEVADRWLGTGYQSILDHAAVTNSLTESERLLRSDALQFVPPPPDASFHPARILQMLRECMRSGNSSGVLLEGAGGVGKTRTLMEVASLALEECGWRVLHAEAGVTPDELIEVLSQSSQPVLLLLDHLDQMQALDPEKFKVAVRKAVKRRKELRVSVLATARPGLIYFSRTPWKGKLRKLTLDPSLEQRIGIVELIIRTRAPKACELLGRSRVTQICGRTPMIAVLIADQLEVRARRGKLSPDAGPELKDESLKEGNLASWLWARLEEDRLNPEPSEEPGGWNQVSPDRVAIAAMLACAPQEDDRLVSAGARAMVRVNGGDKPVSAASLTARSLMGLLRTLRWVEERGKWTAAVHDVVADAVLKEVLLNGDIVRPEALRGVLAPGETDVQHLRILLRSLVRLRSTLRSHPGREPLEAELREWLRDTAAELGRMLAESGQAAAFHVLASVARDRTFKTVLREKWSDLVEPTLAAQPLAPRAVTFIQGGLSSSTGEERDPFIPLALEWVGRHRARREAVLLVIPLVARKELRSADAARLALDFAAHHKDEARTSGMVLYRLLKWDAALPPEVLEDAALAWLNRHRDRFDSQFVLTALLLRKNWIRADRIQKAAEVWLFAFGKEMKAYHVLRALLLHFATQQFPSALEEPLATWLGRWTDHAASMVVIPLLLKVELQRPARLVAALLSSIARFGVETRYQALYHVLRKGFGANVSTRQAGIAWLSRYGDTPDAYVVLNAMMSSERRSEENELLDHAARWVVHNPTRSETGYLLLGIMRVPRLQNQRAIEEAALAWVGAHSASDQVTNVLYQALRRKNLVFPGQWERLAVHWAEERESAEEISQVLRALLKRSPETDVRDRMINLALRWLNQFPYESDTSGVLGPVLKRPDLTNAQCTRAFRMAFAYLERAIDSPHACHVLEGLLRRRRDLSAEERERTIALSDQWIREHPDSPDAEEFTREYRTFLRDVE